MLPVEHRMRRAAEFDVTVRSGGRAGRGSVVVHLSTVRASSAHPSPATSGTAEATVGRSGEPARVGFVVSRSVGTAVRRNRVRRRLRAAVRARLTTLAPGEQLVVRALPSAAGAGYAELVSDLDAALDAARRRVRRPAGRA